MGKYGSHAVGMEITLQNYSKNEISKLKISYFLKISKYVPIE